MADWVICRRPGLNGSTVLVNLDVAFLIEPRTEGSVIHFVASTGDEPFKLAVADGANDIVKMFRARPNA